MKRFTQDAGKIGLDIETDQLDPGDVMEAPKKGELRDIGQSQMDPSNVLTAKDEHADETTVNGGALYQSQNYQYVAQDAQYDLGDEFMNLGIKTHNDANFGSRKTQSYYPDDPLLESHALFTKTLECLDVDEAIPYSPGPKNGFNPFGGKDTKALRKFGKRMYSRADYTRGEDAHPGPVSMATLRSLSFKPREEQNMPFGDKVVKWLGSISLGETVVAARGLDDTPCERILRPYPTTCSEPGSADSGADGYQFGKCFDDDISESSENGKQERSCRSITRAAIMKYRNETHKPQSLSSISAVSHSLRNSGYFSSRKNFALSPARFKTVSVYSKMSKPSCQPALPCCGAKTGDGVTNGKIEVIQETGSPLTHPSLYAEPGNGGTGVGQGPALDAGKGLCFSVELGTNPRR